MPTFLIPVDGSDTSLRAVDHVIGVRTWYRDPVDVHLLNVQHPLPSDVSSHVPETSVKGYHHDEGIRDLAAARSKLDATPIRYVFHIGVGDPGHVITHFARELRCDHIVMATHGRGGIVAPLGSVAARVVQFADRPVLLIK
jgi:nucleotide-binding universal stress UspA family protein